MQYYIIPTQYLHIYTACGLFSQISLRVWAVILERYKHFLISPGSPFVKKTLTNAQEHTVLKNDDLGCQCFQKSAFESGLLF